MGLLKQNKTRSSGFQLKEGIFRLKEGRLRLDIKNKFLRIRMVKHWNRLSRDVSHSWKHSRSGWTELRATCSAPAHCRRVGLDDP